MRGSDYGYSIGKHGSRSDLLAFLARDYSSPDSVFIYFNCQLFMQVCSYGVICMAQGHTGRQVVFAGSDDCLSPSNSRNWVLDKLLALSQSESVKVVGAPKSVSSKANHFKSFLKGILV